MLIIITITKTATIVLVVQATYRGESGVLSPAGAGLCKNCLSASGQFKTKIKNENKTKQKTYIF